MAVASTLYSVLSLNFRIEYKKAWHHNDPCTSTIIDLLYIPYVHVFSSRINRDSHPQSYMVS